MYRLGAGKTLNLREGPGTSYNILAEVVNGDCMSVFSVDGKWAEVDWHGVHAYAYTDYLDISYDDYYIPSPTSGPGPKETTIPVTGRYYWTNQRLSTRTGPGTNYDGKGLTTEYPKYANTRVPVFSAAWDNRNGIWWLQVEVGDNANNRRRVYTGLKRFDGVDVNDLLQEEVLYHNVTLTRSVYPWYGPGPSYQQMGEKVYSGTCGDITFIEGNFVQFEYYENGYYHRCWVKSSDVNLNSSNCYSDSVTKFNEYWDTNSSDSINIYYSPVEYNKAD